MLKAEDFRKCQEARRLELEKQKKAEKEQLIKDQLELVDKQLNEVYKNIAKKKLSIDTKCVDVHENLLPETIEELNKLGYYVEKVSDSIKDSGFKLYFEIPRNEKNACCISTPSQWRERINQVDDKNKENNGKVYSTEDIPKTERKPYVMKYVLTNDSGENTEIELTIDDDINLNSKTIETYAKMIMKLFDDNGRKVKFR